MYVPGGVPIGVVMSIVKVQEPLAAIFPPCIWNTPSEVLKVNIDPAPHEPAAGEVVVLPDINWKMLSVKAKSDNASVVLVFVIVNSNVVVAPAVIGLFKNVFVNVGVS